MSRKNVELVRRAAEHFRDTGEAMSRKNVELVRRAAEHFQRTGEPWWEMLDADIEIYDHDIPDAG
jgi:hypothetical protein